MRVDEKGNLYVAVNRFRSTHPDGKPLALISVPGTGFQLRVRISRCHDVLHHRSRQPLPRESRREGSLLITEDDRRYPKRPLIGVGAIVFDGPRILMAQRGKQPLLGWWSLPGGALETGELLADAVRRETLEETGLEIEALGVFEIFERIMRDQAGAPGSITRIDRLRLPGV